MVADADGAVAEGGDDVIGGIVGVGGIVVILWGFVSRAGYVQEEGCWPAEGHAVDVDAEFGWEGEEGEWGVCLWWFSAFWSIAWFLDSWFCCRVGRNAVLARGQPWSEIPAWSKSGIGAV